MNFIKLQFNAFFFLVLVVATLTMLTNCGGGGGGDKSSSGDLCSLRVFDGTLCSPTTDAVVEIIFNDSSGTPAALCSGSLIAPDAVLTAAHCFDLVRTGSISVNSGGQTVFGSRFVVHPGYSSLDSLTPYDAAILFLSEPLSAAPLPIRVSKAASKNESIRIFGFGEDQSGQSLFEQDIRGSGPKAGSSSIYFSEDGVFVAGDPDQGVCSGDSGGPAIVNFDSDSAVAGIAQAGAFVQGCSDSILSLSEIEQIRGRPFTDAEIQSLMPLSPDGGKTFAVNFYTDVSFPDVTNFITANVPQVGLK